VVSFLYTDIRQTIKYVISVKSSYMGRFSEWKDTAKRSGVPARKGNVAVDVWLGLDVGFHTSTWELSY